MPSNNLFANTPNQCKKFRSKVTFFVIGEYRMHNYECNCTICTYGTLNALYVCTSSTFRCRSFYAPEVIVYEELQKCREAGLSKNKKKNILSRLDLSVKFLPSRSSFCIFGAWYRAAVRRSSSNYESSYESVYNVRTYTIYGRLTYDDDLKRKNMQ